jgi:hypothetical protein
MWPFPIRRDQTALLEAVLDEQRRTNELLTRMLSQQEHSAAAAQEEAEVERAADLMKWAVPAALAWFALILGAIALGLPVFQSDSTILKWVYGAVLLWMLVCIAMVLLMFAGIHSQTGAVRTLNGMVDDAIDTFKRLRSDRQPPHR